MQADDMPPWVELKCRALPSDQMPSLCAHRV